MFISLIKSVVIGGGIENLDVEPLEYFSRKQWKNLGKDAQSSISREALSIWSW